MKSIKLALCAGVLMLAAACTSESSLFDNNCSGNGGIASDDYCYNTLQPYAGPWSTHNH